MKRNILVGLLFVVLLLCLVGCASMRLPEATTEPVVETAVEAAPVAGQVEVEPEGTTEELPTSTVVALVVIVIVLALANERLVEGLKKVGWMKDGQAATWQSVFGGLAVAALALAKYLGIEGLITAPVNELVEVASAFVLLIPIFGQAGVAKLFHEGWKLIGWVADGEVKQTAVRAG